MQYKGKLYGKVGGSLIPLVHTTDDFDRMEKEISELKAKVEKPLPIDEIIKVKARTYSENKTDVNAGYILNSRLAFIAGAKWMRDLMREEETK